MERLSLAFVGDHPKLSADELAVVYLAIEGATHDRPFAARRANRNETFTGVRYLKEFARVEYVNPAGLSADGLRFYYTSGSATAFQLHRATRPDLDGEFVIEALANLQGDSLTVVSGDESTVFFRVGPGELYGSIWWLERSGSGWGTPTLLEQKNGAPAASSPDGRTVYVKRVSGLYVRTRKGADRVFDELFLQEMILGLSWVSPNGCSGYYTFGSPAPITQSQRPL